ncbi:hypothetical protein MD484_g5949, partial [Candolleomyces efflorescens]
MATTSAPKLFASPSFQAASTTLRSTILAQASGASSSNGGDSSSAYVLGIVPVIGSGGYAISTSAPSNAIHVVDGETLRVVASLDGGGGDGSGFSKGKGAAVGAPAKVAHEGGVTCLKSAVGAAATGGLISCGKEGSVVIWDTRSGGGSGKVGVKMLASLHGRSRALLSCDISTDGWTVAAGSELQSDDAIISYWDPRKPSAPLRVHTSTHSDDVTVVSFAPPGYTVNPASSSDTNNDSEDAEMASASQLSEASTVSSNKLLLLTGSTDGLLNISDANDEDEDEAVILTANWGCSIAQAGWVGEKGEGVWAGSDMETFSTWSAELDPILDFDIREPGVHGGEAQWVSDYLVGCHSSSSGSSTPKLRVFTGSNEGDVALISTPHPLTKPVPRKGQNASSASLSNSPWYLQTTWTHQHVGVVRALYYDERHKLVVTGGEDAKLHVWRDSTAGMLYEGDGDVDMDVDDAAPEDDASRRRVKSSRKREESDDEDDAMV